MRFDNTIPNELEPYLLFKTSHNLSYFMDEIQLFYLICTIKSH